MAVSASVVFSSVACTRDNAAQVASDIDGAVPAATATEGTAPAECFDSLMNSLLGALRPAETVSAAVGPKSSAPSPSAATSEVVSTAEVVVDDAAALAMASCLPAAPVVDVLPAGGNILPSAADDPAADAVDSDTDVLLSMFTQGASTPPPVVAENPSPALTAGETETDLTISEMAIVTVPVITTEMADAAVTALADAGEVQAPPVPAGSDPSVSAPPLAATLSVPVPLSSPAPTETAVRDIAAGGRTVETPLRTEPALPQAQRSDAPLPAATDTAHNPSRENGSEGGQSRLQEMLTRLGGGDGAVRSQGDNFRALLQGADSNASVNPAALMYTQPGAAGPAKDPAIPNLPVHTPLRHPEWSDEVSQRIRWVIGHQMQTAELKINPPQLGPIEVRVSIDPDQQVSVTLTSQHALVRETLQESLPRLRDLMNEHGFNAVNVDVSQHSSSDGRKPATQMEMDAAAAARAETDAVETDTIPGPQRNVRGLVDFYA